MLAPKRVKFRKTFKGRTKGIASRGIAVWVAVVRPGRVLFEVEGVTEDLARKALALAQAKLPVRTRFVKREEI